MVSVPKAGSNPGMPAGKKNIVILFDFDKVSTYTRDENSVVVTALAMAGTAKPIGMFVNEGSIDAGDEVEGEDYARGYIQHINFDHPGVEKAVAEFKANNVNSNLGAIVIDCDPSVTTAKIYGTPCAPLKMNQASEQQTSEANLTHFELRTTSRGYPVGIIAKDLIPETDNPEINTFLGLKKTATVTDGDDNG